MDVDIDIDIDNFGEEQKKEQPLIKVSEIANLKFNVDESLVKKDTEQDGKTKTEVKEEKEEGKEEKEEGKAPSEIFDTFNFDVNHHMLDIYQPEDLSTAGVGPDESCSMRIAERNFMNDVIRLNFCKMNGEGEEEEEEPLKKMREQYDETVGKYLTTFSAEAQNIKMDSIHWLLERHRRDALEEKFAFQDDDDDDDIEGNADHITKLYFMEYSFYRKQETYASANGVFSRLLRCAQEDCAARRNYVEEYGSFAQTLHTTLGRPPYGYERPKVQHQGPRVSVHISSTVSPADHNITIPTTRVRRAAEGSSGKEKETREDKKGNLKRARDEKDGKDEKERKKKEDEMASVTCVGKKQVSLLCLSAVSSNLSGRLFYYAEQQVQNQSNSIAAAAGGGSGGGKSYMRFESPDKVAVTTYGGADAAFTVERLRSRHSYKRGAMSALLADGQGPHARRGIETDFLLTAVAEEQMLMLEQGRGGVLTGTEERPSVLGAVSAVVAHKSVIRRLRAFFDRILAGPEQKRMTVHWGRTVASPCPATEVTIRSWAGTYFDIRVVIVGADRVRCTPCFKEEMVRRMKEKGMWKRIMPVYLEFNLEEFTKIPSSKALFELFYFTNIQSQPQPQPRPSPSPRPPVQAKVN